MSHKQENVLLGLCIAILAVLLLLWLTGCTPSTRAQNIDIMWHSNDGDCLLVADGMTLEQAQKLKTDWEFEDCKITVNEDQ